MRGGSGGVLKSINIVDIKERSKLTARAGVPMCGSGSQFDGSWLQAGLRGLNISYEKGHRRGS